MLIEKLNQTMSIPQGTKSERVKQIMAVLVHRLYDDLQKEYSWMAHCTVAVEAGQWGGERRRKRRLKVRQQIQICATYLAIPDPTASLPHGWERHGLYYGYGAPEAYARAHGSADPTRDGIGLALAQHMLTLLGRSEVLDPPAHTADDQK